MRFWQKLTGILRENNQNKTPGKNQEEKPNRLTPYKEKKLSGRVSEDIEEIKKILGNPSDLVIREFSYYGIPAAAVMIDGLIDKIVVTEGILKPLMLEAKIAEDKPENLYKSLKEEMLAVSEIKETDNLAEFLLAVFSGEVGLLLEKSTAALLASTKGWATRSVSEPLNEVVVRGPQEAFTETIRVNTALIRRRIRSPHLRLEALKIGRTSQTDVVIAYLADIADSKIVEEVRTRLSRIDIDAVLESGYLEEFIEDDPFNIFPQVKHTERPDKAVADMLEGKVVILTDGTPLALVVPATMPEFFQAAEDYYEKYFISNFLRMIRVIAFFLAMFLPSLYIAIITFHQEMIPTELLINIWASRSGVPFPAFVEALIMELAFEALREAGVRLPRPVGQAVSIVGALIIGQAAVEAGIVSTSMVIVVALTGIASFAIPAFNMAVAARIYRFFIMILAATFGMFGLMMGFIYLVIMLCNTRSFGVPYLAPLAPMNLMGQKDMALRVPWWLMIKRPKPFRPKDERRVKEGLRPGFSEGEKRG